jgi:hypothetical protein
MEHTSTPKSLSQTIILRIEGNRTLQYPDHVNRNLYNCIANRMKRTKLNNMNKKEIFIVVHRSKVLSSNHIIVKKEQIPNAPKEGSHSPSGSSEEELTSSRFSYITFYEPGIASTEYGVILSPMRVSPWKYLPSPLEAR